MTQMNYTARLKQTRVAIIANGKYQSKRVASKIFSTLKHDRNFYLSKENPDIIISIGGDGMLLSAFHMYEKALDRVRFVGIHTGHLGFYTDYRDFEVDTFLKNLRADQGEKISYPLLRMTVTMADGRVVTARALNEASLRRLEKTMVADVSINGTFLERFRGDGITVSTPTGSTAYNKSIGGAVLHPTVEAFQMTEIASLNNRVYRTLGSSAIIPKGEKVTIEPKRVGSYSVSFDNKSYNYRNVAKMEFSLDDKKISFLSTPHHTGFWERVKDAFIGEVEV